MRIPQQVILGGMKYSVNIVDNDLTIEISSKSQRPLQEVMLWHEILHHIISVISPKNNKDPFIEALALHLRALVVDNPEMFQSETVCRECGCEVDEDGHSIHVGIDCAAGKDFTINPTLTKTEYDNLRSACRRYSKIDPVLKAENDEPITEYVDFELYLLELWKETGYENVYKYKNRIKALRTPSPNTELFYDCQQRMFNDVQDIASVGLAPEECAISITELIANRTR